MTLRTTTNRRPAAPLAAAARSAAWRRQRRLQLGDARLYCATNGCASILALDPATGIASCAICGFRRRPD